MFIILNNRPLNIFRIQKVTGIIELTPIKYKFTVATIKNEEYSNYKEGVYAEGKENYYGISQKLLNILDRKYGIRSSRVGDNSKRLLKSFEELERIKKKFGVKELWSYSKLDSWRTCKYEWFLNYVKKEKPRAVPRL